MDRLIVAKIGGNLFEEPERLGRFLDRFCPVAGPSVLVHGGGPQADRVARSLGIEPVMWNGRRITDGKMLDVVTMVYAGLNGKNLVARMQAQGRNAISLSGVDGNLLTAVRRPVGEIDFGFVGDITPNDVNIGFLQSLLAQGIVPVINAVTHDGKGSLLNTNADTIAVTVAAALSIHYTVELLLITDRPGVLADPDDPSSVLTELDPQSIALLMADGTIAGGMMPKIDGSLVALKGGVASVRIGNEEMLVSEREGTAITALKRKEES